MAIFRERSMRIVILKISDSCRTLVVKDEGSAQMHRQTSGTRPPLVDLDDGVSCLQLSSDNRRKGGM